MKTTTIRQKNYRTRQALQRAWLVVSALIDRYGEEPTLADTLATINVELLQLSKHKAKMPKEKQK